MYREEVNSVRVPQQWLLGVWARQGSPVRVRVVGSVPVRVLVPVPGRSTALYGPTLVPRVKPILRGEA